MKRLTAMFLTLLLLLSLIPTIRRFYRKHRTLAQPGMGVGCVWGAGGPQS